MAHGPFVWECFLARGHRLSYNAQAAGFAKAIVVPGGCG